MAIHSRSSWQQVNPEEKNQSVSCRSFAWTKGQRSPNMCAMHSHLAVSVNRFWRVAAITLSWFFLAGPASTYADAEREALARLTHEIEALAPLIATAESHASPDTRIRFRYDWLRQDLERVRSGIQEHIDAQRNQPRTFPPLRGDYRQ
jgi:RAQPRD family integrative conjugative element protein